MKKTLLFTSILMIAGAMNAWADACAKGAAGNYGAITIATDGDKCVATLDPNDTTSVNIPNDIAIDQFVYDRVYKMQDVQQGSTNAQSLYTICLPFTARYSGAEFYTNLKISNYNGGNGNIVWQIQADSYKNTTLDAGVPYIVKAWNPPAYTPTSPINTSSLSPVTFGDNEEWEFRGTFNYKKWEEGDSQIGHVYGFVASDTTTASGSFKAGQFVKVKAGAFIKPMRAYLYYNKKSANAGRPAANGVKGFAAIDDEDLPNTIEVVFRDEKGEIQSIAKMNTVTGEFTSVTGWYDMKGRKLDKKPTQKGTYFNNGKKVVIK